MDRHKLSALFALLIVSLALESLFNLPVYLVILLLIIAFGFIWYSSEIRLAADVRKNNENLLHELKTSSSDSHLKTKQLLTIVSSIPFPLLLLDEMGKIVIYNTQALAFRHSDAKIELDYLHNDFDPAIQEVIKDAFILEKEQEERIRIDDVDYQAYMVPVTSHGKFSGCLILLQDMTKALSGEKMQKRFIADASHELKTPISVIKGMSEILIRDDFNDPEAQKDFLNQINSEVQRLESIVKDLLELSKLSVEQPILHRTRIDFHELAQNVCKPLMPLINEKGLKLNLDLKGEARLFCDAQKMSLVLNNLLVIAAKYSDSGTITLRTFTTDDDYYIQVQDEGCGFNVNEQSRIFERFYRVNQSRARAEGGSGLGLAIVKSVIDAHGGVIEVRSELNVGTVFTIKLNKL